MLRMRHCLRIMRRQDIPAVLRLQAACYAPAMVEAEAAVRRRLDAAPDTAWVAEDREGVCAYLVAYRSRVGKVTPLGGDFALPAAADCLYFHDLAVARRHKGRGTGLALANFAWEQALREGLRYSALVSVQDSRAYWERLGYRVQDALAPAEQANLGSYPGPACYMLKNLGIPSGAATL